jgi:thioredoxin
MVARDSILRSELQWRQIVASLGLNLDEQKAVDRFRKAVVEPSMTKLVILDFWAEWCGPCKALTPVLEKVAAEYADKGVILAKVNVDEEQFIAAQFQVRSIPTVYAMFQGQPVADLTQARSESQLKQYLDQILSQLAGPGAPARKRRRTGPLIAMGEEIWAGRWRARGDDLCPDHRNRARQCPCPCRPRSRAAGGRPPDEAPPCSMGSIPSWRRSCAGPGPRRAGAGRGSPRGRRTGALRAAARRARRHGGPAGLRQRPVRRR